MSTQTKLEKYSEAVERRNEHVKENAKVFEAHEKLVYAVIEAENELRDEVAEMQGLAQDKETIVATGMTHKVIYIPQTQRVYDEDAIKRLLTSAQILEVVKDNPRPPKIVIRNI